MTTGGTTLRFVFVICAHKVSHAFRLPYERSVSGSFELRMYANTFVSGASAVSNMSEIVFVEPFTSDGAAGDAGTILSDEWDGTLARAMGIGNTTDGIDATEWKLCVGSFELFDFTSGRRLFFV